MGKFMDMIEPERQRRVELQYRIEADDQLSPEGKQARITEMWKQFRETVNVAREIGLQAAQEDLETAQAAYQTEFATWTATQDWGRQNAANAEAQALAETARTYADVAQRVAAARAAGDEYTLRALQRIALPKLQARTGTGTDDDRSRYSRLQREVGEWIEQRLPEPLRNAETAIGEAESALRTIETDSRRISERHSSQFGGLPLIDAGGMGFFSGGGVTYRNPADAILAGAVAAD